MPIPENLFIFEMANNHQGSLDHGLRLIEVLGGIARKHGINGAVKLQYRNLPDFVHPGFREKEGVAHVRRFLDTMLTAEEFRRMVER